MRREMAIATNQHDADVEDPPHICLDCWLLRLPPEMSCAAGGELSLEHLADAIMTDGDRNAVFTCGAQPSGLVQPPWDCAPAGSCRRSVTNSVTTSGPFSAVRRTHNLRLAGSVTALRSATRSARSTAFRLRRVGCAKGHGTASAHSTSQGTDTSRAL
jgi:hypothetical protein